MEISEAKSFVNRTVNLVWLDRKGLEQSEVVAVFSVGFKPMYGPCLVTSHGDILLDRVVRGERIDTRIAS